MTVTMFSGASLRTMNTASLAEAARTYARMGIAVFPLSPHQKEPRLPRLKESPIPGGCYSATTDEALIGHWWSRFPQANIGIATGQPSGWWVLDIDPRHGGLSSLEAMERQVVHFGATTSLRATLWQLTGGGGMHLIFQMPSVGIEPPNHQFAGYQGVELVKGGRYVVAPPSVHPHGFLYQWQSALPPAPFPPALLELFIEHRQRQFSRASLPPSPHARWKAAHRPGSDREQDPEFWLHAALRNAIPGKRHNYALFLAIQLVSVVGCSFEEAEFWMHEYVSQVTQRPHDCYSLEDALECLAFAWEKYR